MLNARVGADWRVTIPKEIRESAEIAPGDMINFQITATGAIELRVIRPLQYFFNRFQPDEPYDDDRIRAEWQAEAAEDVMKHMRES